ncbi:hypothetical protein JDN40_08540 [Rhodomicrobium vannielii ATCC 17100]|uniref:hypothetical protein n=1 Tax=Rhodomicrobium vannielii TaxID=1069 RepID=UPI0019189A84|nr:hypothetical protein [Rhodomicrobium vannielii]MBJ7534151.1 hypothetical protein [Rhodomicrobium vannielii ATCC 17100]
MLVEGEVSEKAALPLPFTECKLVGKATGGFGIGVSGKLGLEGHAADGKIGFDYAMKGYVGAGFKHSFGAEVDCSQGKN